MIKYIHDNGHLELETEGTFVELLAESMEFLHVLHVRMCNDNLALGFEFERLMKEPDVLDEIFKPREGDSAFIKSEVKEE